MRRNAYVLIGLMMLAAACSGGGSLSAEEEAWCVDNMDEVDEAAEDLGLMDFVSAYYDSKGDGLGGDGEPRQTERNIEVSEDLRARNAEDPEQLVDDLVTNYLDHPDGEAACAAAYAESQT